MRLALCNRIERHIERVTETGCWIWTRAKYPSGYGHLVYNGKHYAAHRAAYEAYIGPIPFGACVLHRCDVRSCCNPAHLWIGSKKDNSDDMISKGRAKHPKAEDHPNSKLTAEQVLQIRSLHARGTRLKDIARPLGVKWTTVANITQGRAWLSV